MSTWRASISCLSCLRSRVVGSSDASMQPYIDAIPRVLLAWSAVILSVITDFFKKKILTSSLGNLQTGPRLSR